MAESRHLIPIRLQGCAHSSSLSSGTLSRPIGFRRIKKGAALIYRLCNQLCLSRLSAGALRKRHRSYPCSLIRRSRYFKSFPRILVCIKFFLFFSDGFSQRRHSFTMSVTSSAKQSGNVDSFYCFHGNLPSSAYQHQAPQKARPFYPQILLRFLHNRKHL